MVNDFLTAANVRRSAPAMRATMIPRRRYRGADTVAPLTSGHGRVEAARALRRRIARIAYFGAANAPAVPVESSRTASSRLESLGCQR